MLRASIIILTMLIGFISLSETQCSQLYNFSKSKTYKQIPPRLLNLLSRYQSRISGKSYTAIEEFVDQMNFFLTRALRSDEYVYETLYLGGGRAAARMKAKDSKTLELDISVLEFDPEVEFGDNIQSGVFVINLHLGIVEWISRLEHKNIGFSRVRINAKDVVNKHLIYSLQEAGFKRNFWSRKNYYFDFNL